MWHLWRVTTHKKCFNISLSVDRDARSYFLKMWFKTRLSIFFLEIIIINLWLAISIDLGYNTCKHRVMLSLLTMAFMPVYAQWCMQICTLYISYTFLISGTLSYYNSNFYSQLKYSLVFFLIFRTKRKQYLLWFT